MKIPKQKKQQKQKTSLSNKKQNGNSFSDFFNRFSAAVTRITGKAYTFITAIVIVLVWGISGPVFNFSDDK